MELQEIKELIKLFDESESSYMEIERADAKLKLKKPVEMNQSVYAGMPMLQAQPAGLMLDQNQELQGTSAEQRENPAENKGDEAAALEGTKVLAPLVGVFYSAPSPEEQPFVQVGDKVEEGQVLCLIEAMKMMSEISATKSGTIKQIYVKNQDVVEFEQPLFLIGD